MIAGSNLEYVLSSGEFAVTGELGPPKNGDFDVVREKARILRGHVDAVNITDCQTAIVRMSSLAAGLIAMAEGVEPVMQMTCRDRNRIGMQSDILGAAALGIKNLLCLTGDHQKFGNHPHAKGVFDMDSIQLLGMVKDMRDGKRFQCGEVIKNYEPRLFLGAAANPFADPFEYRPVRLAKKVDAGASFIQTQIIYNVDKFARFMEMVRDLGLHEKVYILAGVTPPKSLGMARYMKKFVPGLDVTDDVIKRLQDASDQREEGINICVDIINRVREIPGVAGVHVMAIEWEEAVADIVSRAGLSARPEPRGIEPCLISSGTIEEVVSKAEEQIRAELEKQVDQARTEAAASRDLVTKEKEKAAGEISELKSQLDRLKDMADREEIKQKQLAEELAKTRAALEKARGVSEAGMVCKSIVEPQGVAAEAAPVSEIVSGEALSLREQRALQSINKGLEALRKILGLTEDQLEALKSFFEAEFLLHMGEGQPAAAASAVPEPPRVQIAEPVPELEEAVEPAAEEVAAAEAEEMSVEAAIEEEAPPAGVAEEPMPAGIPPCPPELSPDEWKRKWVVRLTARGNVLLHKREVQEAESAFRQALKIDPGYEKARTGLERAGKREAVPEVPEEKPASPEAEKEVAPAVEVEELPEAPVPESEAAPPEEKKPEAKRAASLAVEAEGVEISTLELAEEAATLMERAGSIPQDMIMEPASGVIQEVVIGDGEKALTVGGSSALPFHLFEGDMPNSPRIAYEILDMEPEEWPEPLMKYYSDVASDPVAWAKKCVEEYGAEAICMSLVSTDPNGVDRPAGEAARVAQSVVDGVDVPVILWGCGNADKDTETLREVTNLTGSKKVCIGPLTDVNYRTLGATAMAFQLPVVAATPIDVNLAKQLNILLENLGMSLNQILMDPSIGAAGYGLEYTYSVMERIRLAALTQQDDKLQVPFICNLGREVWKAKECRLPSDPLMGDQERRGIMMEAVTASTLLLAGGELMVMRHPKAVSLTESLIRGMM